MSSPQSDSADFSLHFEDIQLANLIDAVCDRFESAWKSGTRPTIKPFLDETPAPYVPRLFSELVRIDIEYRTGVGEHPSVDEYLSQFPQYSDALTSLREKAPYAETVVLPVRAPKRLGKYELRDRVGGGGFGYVWKAWDTQLARIVAVKIPRDRIEGGDPLKAFLREARAAAELSHPHVVRVIEAGSENGVAYLVSEFIDGITLRQLKEARPLGWRETAELCALAAEAMEHAHQKGVVHRDLKPGNILIDGAGKPHVADFGLATRRIDGKTIAPTGELAGTPAYMAPEQLVESEKTDARCDVYALGTTLYELLTGTVPFTGDQKAVLYQVAHQKPVEPRKRNRSIPADLQTICLKAMEKDRRDRYQTAGELAADLRRYLNDEPIHARPASKLERSWRAIRRNPVVSSAVSIAVVATSISLALALEHPSPAKGSLGIPARIVALATQPEGARMVAYRLDDETGEPDPSTRVESPDRSPCRVPLVPGDYLVVAALDDGRFHEVFRHVPEREEVVPVGYRNRFWRVIDGDVIEVLPIQIPLEPVAAGMAFMPGSDRFEGLSVPAIAKRVPAFYIDPFEFTVGEFRRLDPWQGAPNDTRYVPRPDDYALAIHYDQAVAAAERVGKRLPSEAEYEFAAAMAGKEIVRRDLPKLEDAVGPVGTPSWDFLETAPRVFGLASNVAEWTTSCVRVEPPRGKARPLPEFIRVLNVNTRHRAVRGGPKGDWNERRRAVVYQSENEIDERIGFRTVRSARPRLEASDLIVIVK